jgi:pyridoxine kinase
MSKKILTIQDISCYGSCSITVALPILSSLGIETAILPSAILSTHTSGFKHFTVLDLTDEMPKIIAHWISEGIKFDAIYTGYIGDVRQFDYILECKEKLLKEDGLFIVDPAMADHGKLYPALSDDIVDGMKKICSQADYVIPNITEACFLTDVEYSSVVSDDLVDELLEKLIQLGAKNVILTSVSKSNNIGATYYDGENRVTVLKENQEKSYHGTGDIFSSVVIGYLLNNYSIQDTLDKATNFIIDSINATKDDLTHNYGVKYEDVLFRK